MYYQCGHLLLLTLLKLEYLPIGYLNSNVDILHNVLMMFRMGEYLCCDHHAAYRSPTGFVLVPGAYALFNYSFRPDSKGPYRCWHWVSLLAALSRPLSRSSLVSPWWINHSLSYRRVQRCDAWQRFLGKSPWYIKKWLGSHLPQYSTSSYCMINNAVLYLFSENWIGTRAYML